MLAQIVVGHDSRIYQVNLLQGHNNDSGAFGLSGLKEKLANSHTDTRAQHRIKLVADAGMERVLHHL
jgi:hypothetical protein